MAYSRFTSNTKKQNVCSVNESFFDKWSDDMAYVLGFFVADGCLTKNAKRQNYYIEFVSTDLDILEKIKGSLSATQVVSRKKLIDGCKQAYRIQIGSKRMFCTLREMGILQNKSKLLKYFVIPDQYFSDFTRGYFDGDGYSNCTIYYKKDRNKYGRVLFGGFTSGSRPFLAGFREQLDRLALMEGGTLCSHSNNFALAYSGKDTGKLFYFMYNNLSKKIYLDRKYRKFVADISKYGSVA